MTADLHLITEDRHGEDNTYRYGCRCKRCTRAATREDALRRLDRLAGRPRSVPASEVIGRVKALVERPLSYAQVAEMTGASVKAIRDIYIGRQQSMLRRTAERILAVPEDAPVKSGTVSAVGATRRLRALYAMGHFNHVIAKESGLSRDAICALVAGEWATIDHDRLQRIHDAYNKLSMTSGDSWKTKRFAEQNQWPPPLAWDDDTIDDPDAAPVLDAAEPDAIGGPEAVARWLMGESVILDAASRRLVIAHFMEWSELNTEQIGARVGMEPESVKRVWERIKRKARDEGRPVPRRRVYLQRVTKTGAVAQDSDAA